MHVAKYAHTAKVLAVHRHETGLLSRRSGNSQAGLATLVYRGHLAPVGRVLLAGATGLGMDAWRDDMRSHREAPGQRPRCVRSAARLLGIGVAALMTAACGGSSGPATPSAPGSSAASGSASSLAP